MCLAMPSCRQPIWYMYISIYHFSHIFVCLHFGFSKMRKHIKRFLISCYLCQKTRNQLLSISWEYSESLWSINGSWFGIGLLRFYVIFLINVGRLPQPGGQPAVMLSLRGSKGSHTWLVKEWECANKRGHERKKCATCGLRRREARHWVK